MRGNLFPLLFLSLTACDKPQNISYIDDSGKEVQFVLKDSSEPEDVLNALLYMGSSTKGEYGGNKLAISSEISIRANDSLYLNSKLSGNATISGRSGANGSLSFSFDCGVFDTTNSSNKLNLDATLDMNSDYSDKTAYIDYNLAGKLIEGSSNTGVDKGGKLKLTYSDIIEWIYGYNSLTYNAVMPLGGYGDLFPKPIPGEIKDGLQSFIENYPNSTIEIANVSKKGYSLELHLNAGDILKNLTADGENNIPELKTKEEATVIYKLRTSDNLPLELKVNGDLTGLLEHVYNSSATGTVLKPSLSKPKFKLSLNISSKYSDSEPKLKVLSANEKKEYLPISNTEIQ